MVPKVTVGAGLRGALAYDLYTRTGERRGEWVAGTLGGTPREMSKQAAAFRSLRPDCHKPIWRCSLSLPPTDGQLIAAEWEILVRDFMAEMSIPEAAAWVAVRHSDRDHDHIHFTLLRVLPDGRLWDQEYSAKRAIRACQAIEQKHLLSQHSRDPPTRARTTPIEKLASNRQGKVVSKKFIQDQVDAVLKNHQHLSFDVFKRQLAIQGIQAEVYAPKGKWSGVTYTHDGIKWSGSKLGTDYSPIGLGKRGLVYEDQSEAVPSNRLQLPHSNHEEGNCEKTAKQSGSLAVLKELFVAGESSGILMSVGAASPVGVQRAKMEFQAANQRMRRTIKMLNALIVDLIKLGAEIFELAINFVKWLLSKLGVSFEHSRPIMQTTTLPGVNDSAQLSTKFLISVPAHLSNENIDQLDMLASVQIGQIHDAVIAADDSLLPSQGSNQSAFLDFARKIRQLTPKEEPHRAEETDSLNGDFWSSDPEFNEFCIKLTASKALASDEKTALRDKARRSRKHLEEALAELRAHQKIHDGLAEVDKEVAAWEHAQQLDEVNDDHLGENSEQPVRPGM